MFEVLQEFFQTLPVMGFALGLAASLTPCVYPMIPMTVAILWGGNKVGSWKKAFLSSLAYFFGLATVYTLLGVFVAKTGGLFGVWMHKPIVLRFISAVFVIMAAELFDLVDFKILTGASSSYLYRLNSSLFFKFIAGGLSGLVASPCATPVLAVILTRIAVEGSVFIGGLSLFFYALGFSFPLLIISIFFNRHVLPRPGAWMVWVKRALGLFMLSLAYNYTTKLGLNEKVGFWVLFGIMFGLSFYRKFYKNGL